MPFFSRQFMSRRDFEFPSGKTAICSLRASSENSLYLIYDIERFSCALMRSLRDTRSNGHKHLDYFGAVTFFLRIYPPVGPRIRRFVAPRQGLVVCPRRVPRALPWAGLLKPTSGQGVGVLETAASG
jgi:hypothetical protein